MRVRKSKTVMPRRGFLVEGASKFLLGLSGLSMSMSFLQPTTCFSKKFLRTYWREQKGHENDSGSSVGLVILVSSEWSLKVTFFTFFIVRLVFMFLWKLRNAQIILHINLNIVCAFMREILVHKLFKTCQIFVKWPAQKYLSLELYKTFVPLYSYIDSWTLNIYLF